MGALAALREYSSRYCYLFAVIVILVGNIWLYQSLLIMIVGGFSMNYDGLTQSYCTQS